MKAGPRTSLQAGVSLIELTVAVVVIAILVAVAIPAYRHHVLRLKSVDATRELRMLALRLAECHKRTGSFTRLDDTQSACIGLPYPIPEGTYSISGEIAADSFLLTASPLGSQEVDSRCAAFTLDHRGQQGVTGSGTTQDCWGVRRN
jgi:type IV pilus assembly protein PilE